MKRYSYALAVGYNVALVSLVNVQDITISGQKKIYPPQSFGTYRPGTFKMRGDGLYSTVGWPFLRWGWRGNPGGWITYGQARYFNTTYCAGGYSGKVTIYSMTQTFNTYERYNAVMQLPYIDEAEPNFKIFQGFEIKFIRLEAL
jgi:hypothetical protein